MEPPITEVLMAGRRAGLGRRRSGIWLGPVYWLLLDMQVEMGELRLEMSAWVSSPHSKKLEDPPGESVEGKEMSVDQSLGRSHL